MHLLQRCGRGIRDPELLPHEQIARYRSDGFVIPEYRVSENILIDLQNTFSEALPSDPGAALDRFPHILRNPALATAIN